jgi:hypothetical protein
MANEGLPLYRAGPERARDVEPDPMFHPKLEGYTRPGVLVAG